MILKIIEPHTKFGVDSIKYLNLYGIQNSWDLIDDNSLVTNTAASIQVIFQYENSYDTGNNHCNNKKTDCEGKKHLHLSLKGRIKLFVEIIICYGPHILTFECWALSFILLKILLTKLDTKKDLLSFPKFDKESTPHDNND